MKKCEKCLLTYSDSQFYRNKNGNFALFKICKKCHNEKCREYRVKNYDKVRAIEIKHFNKNRSERLQKMKDYYQNLRQKLFNAYGNKCACCGELRQEFFAIDHIQGGGNLEKRNQGTRPLYRKIISEGFPKDKYQILCHNCNMSLGFYGYCPHHPEIKRAVIYGGRQKPTPS